MLASRQVAEEAEHLIGQIMAHLFPGKVGEDPQELLRSESEAIEQAIRADMRQPGGDMLPWSMRVLTARVMKKQADGIHDFIVALERVCTATLADQFFGQIEPAVLTLASSPMAVLTGVESLARQQFAGAVDESERARHRVERLNTHAMRETLLSKLAVVRHLQTEAVAPVKAWMKAIETDWDTHPITPLLDAALTQMEEVAHSIKGLVVELHKVCELEKMDRDAWVEALTNKKRVRQVIGLSQDLARDFDFSDPVRDRHVRRFIGNHQLDQPGTICSQ